jgi:hypothetical protein
MTGETDATKTPYVAVRLHHPQTGRDGRLWFALFTRDGRAVAPPTGSVWDEIRARCTARLQDFCCPSTADDRAALTFQAQVFTEGFTPSSAAADADGLQLFSDFTRRIAARWSTTPP